MVYECKGATIEADEEGYITDISLWSPELAALIAETENIEMDGLGVLSFFNSLLPREVHSVLEDNDLTVRDVDVFVFHQASRLALDNLVKLLDIPANRVVCEMEMVGNLVSASIPHALQQAMAKGTAKPGDLAILCGFGVGLSWGTVLVRL